MQIILREEAQQQIRDELFPGHADKERCGVLLGVIDKRNNTVLIEKAVAVKNTSDTPGTDFAMKAKHVRKALEGTGDGEDMIVGAVHTHKRGASTDPSWQDVEFMTPGMVGAVYHEVTRTLTYYNHEVGFLDKEILPR